MSEMIERGCSIEVTEEMEQAGIAIFDSWAEKAFDYSVIIPSNYLVRNLVLSIFRSMHSSEPCSHIYLESPKLTDSSCGDFE